MKKIFRSLLLCTILAISVVPVSAQAEYLLPNNLPENIIQEIRESDEEVKVIDEAKFILGDTIYIDISKVDTTELEEYKTGIEPYATEMPTATWNWNNGIYEADYSVSRKISYTQYNFTGYDQYYVEAKETYRGDGSSGSGDHINKGIFDVLLMTGSGQGVVSAEYQVTDGYENIRFYNCDSGTKYAFAIRKADDGSTSEGWIKININ